MYYEERLVTLTCPRCGEEVEKVLGYGPDRKGENLCNECDHKLRKAAQASKFKREKETG